MGDVYRAIDTRLGRAVAVKIAQPQFIQRFEREARAISSLNHPHICTLYDVGPNYLVMELVEGETIAARLKRGVFPMTAALLYAAQILAALAEAHDKGIIHRDLKPGNIMIAKSGIKVLDFGLAKSGQDETVTVSGMVMGTPAYMAPEQREGKPADARSDIYSFGCVLYEMLTGARVGYRRRRVPSRKLEKIVSRCLEEDPGRRWQSVADLEGELSATGRGATARLLSFSPRAQTHGQANHRACGFRKCDRRPSLRWRAAPNPGCPIGQCPSSVPASRRARAPDARAHGPAIDCEAHVRSCGRSLRADSKRGGRGGLDHKPRKRVRVERARKELPNRRNPGPGAGATSKTRGRLQGAGPNGKTVRDPSRRLASTRGGGAQFAGRGNYVLTGGLEVLQRGNEGFAGEGTVSG